MNGPERKPVIGYLWFGLALLTCPCHSPIILAAILGGTTAGALFSKHWGIAVVGLTGLFVLSLWQAKRAFRKRSLAHPGQMDDCGAGPGGLPDAKARAGSASLFAAFKEILDSKWFTIRRP